MTLILHEDGTDTLQCLKCKVKVYDGEGGRHKGDQCPHCVPLIRQYFVLYKREGSQSFSKLEPGVHLPLYNKPEIWNALRHMRSYPHIEGLAIRLGNEQYNIIATERETKLNETFDAPPGS
jgi:hypothetical protein